MTPTCTSCDAKITHMSIKAINATGMRCIPCSLEEIVSIAISVVSLSFRALIGLRPRTEEDALSILRLRGHFANACVELRNQIGRAHV